MTGDLPKGWAWARLGELATLMRNGLSTKPNAATGVAILRISSVRPGKINLNDVRFLSADGSALDQFTVRKGDILFTRYNGSREFVGIAAAVPDVGGRLVYPDKLIRVQVPHEICQPKFLALASNVGASRAFIEGRIRTTAGQAGISGGDLRELPLPIAPRAEQERIVEAADSHLSRLDETTTLLERVQRNLKRYRASVLKAAVEGRLVPTEAEIAREEKRAYEPASELLKRILTERRLRWEKEGRRGKYVEPEPLDTKGLPGLPEGWCWSTLKAVADIKGGITKGQKRRPDDVLRSVPYLRVANVQRGHIDLSEVKEIEATDDEINDLRLVVGDVLFNEGGDRDKLGRGWVWEGQLPLCIHQNHVFRARLPMHLLLPKFVSWYGNSFGQRYFLDEGKQTTNLASINMTKLGALPIPIPPLPEQTRIVAEIERLFSLVDTAENAVAVQSKRVTRLRQSILKWAFEGKLVDQDPNDEPASALLARIKADQPAPKAAPRGRKKAGGGE
jgi:type I restriction enzyme S subunit